MKNWKRLLSVLLALVLVGTMVSGLALAEDKKKVDVPYKEIKVAEEDKKMELYVEQYRFLGEYLTVTYEDVTIDPEKEEANYDYLDWTSSDTSIVRIDTDGYVRPRKAGKATITVSSHMRPAVKDTIEITVKDYPVVKSITFNAPSFELKVGERLALHWNMTISPADAYFETISVKSSNPEVVSAWIEREDDDDDWIEIWGAGLKAGTAKLTVTITNADSSVVTGSVDVTVTEKPLQSISFSKSSVTIKMLEDDSVNLWEYLTITPENADRTSLYWESSNEEVVSVHNGTATGIKAGTATVTVKSRVNPALEASIEITVVEETEIAEIKFPIKTMTLYYVAKAGKLVDSGNSASIVLIVQPELAHVESIQWTTTNANVAIPHPSSTKSYGATIEAVGKGTCVISAYVSDGKTEYSASFKVKVVEKTPTAKLSKKNVTLKVGEKLTLKATDARSKAALKGKWSSSDPSVAKVNKKGVVKAKGPGRAVITFKPETKGMKPVTCVIKVTK